MYGKKRITIERKKDILGRRRIAAAGGKSYQHIGFLIECSVGKRYLITNCNRSRCDYTDSLQEAKKIAHNFAKLSKEWYGFQNENLFNK